MDNNDGGNAAKEIATAASSTGLLGCTYHTLLTLVLLYHHSACNSDTAVLLAGPLYSTKQLL